MQDTTSRWRLSVVFLKVTLVVVVVISPSKEECDAQIISTAGSITLGESFGRVRDEEPLVVSASSIVRDEFWSWYPRTFFPVMARWSTVSTGFGVFEVGALSKLRIPR